MFKVQVKLGSKAWTVDRRYREFDHLYNQVSVLTFTLDQHRDHASCRARCLQIKKQDAFFNAKFPSKRFLNNFSPDNINKRKRGLDEFIKSAVASPSVLKMPILCHFLKITSEHLSYLESEPNFKQVNPPLSPQQQPERSFQSNPTSLKPPAFNRQVSHQANGEAAAENDFNLGATNNPV